MARRSPAARGRARRKANITARNEIRALNVLEYLNHFGEGRVSDVAKALDMPQSSTSRLLSRLSEAGFLAYERRGRVYRSSIRAAFLGMQAANRLFGTGRPMHMIDELIRFSCRPVIITSRNQTNLNIVHVETGVPTQRACFQVGETSPLVNSASGKVMLSRFADSFIQLLVRRYNAEYSTVFERVSPKTFLDEVDQARQCGYVVQPVEAAVRSMGRRCCQAGAASCPVDCCLAQRGSHLVTPIPGIEGHEMAAIVEMPIGLQTRHHGEFAGEVRAIVDRCMPAHA